MENLNRGIVTPGIDNIQPTRQKSSMPQCPFGIECSSCMIALKVDNNIKCSISVLAAEALKTGIIIGKQDGN